MGLTALLTAYGLQGLAADYAFLNLTGTGQSYELAAIRKIGVAQHPTPRNHGSR